MNIILDKVQFCFAKGIEFLEVYTFNNPNPTYKTIELIAFFMLTKTCPCCGQNLGINYYIRLESEDGKPYHTVCKDCREKEKIEKSLAEGGRT